MAHKPHVRFDFDGNELDEQGNRVMRRRTLGDRSPDLPHFHARFGVAPSTLVPEPKNRLKPPTAEDKKRLAKYRRQLAKIFKND